MTGARAAQMRSASLLLTVADDGRRLPAGGQERLFEKLQRGRSEGNIVGVGLELAIRRAAARLHGGDIRAMNNILTELCVGYRFVIDTGAEVGS